MDSSRCIPHMTSLINCINFITFVSTSNFVHISAVMHMLLQYVADQTPLRAEEVQLLVVKEHDNSNCDQPTYLSTSTDHPNPMPLEIYLREDDLQILEGQETMGGLKAGCLPSTNYLVSMHNLL